MGIIFIISGTIKLLDLESFSQVIDAFAILPGEFCYPFAIIIALAEIISGLGLAADIKGSLFTILMMLLMFVAVLGYAIYMGYDIDCGCFGPNDPETIAFSGLKSSLFRDLCMIALIFYLYLWRFKNNHFPFSLKFKKQEIAKNEIY